MSAEQTDRTEAFIRLLTEHERKLGRYAMSMVPHAQDADDILQEAKIVMWRSFDRFELGTNFGAWARKVVFHQVLSYRRKKAKLATPLSEETLTLLAADAEEMVEHFDSRKSALSSCIAKLQEEHREILALRYRDEMSIESISERVDRTVGAVYRLLSRTRRNLHDCVSKTVELGRTEDEGPQRAF